MKNKLLFPIMVVICLISCAKEGSIENNGNPPTPLPGVNDSIYLWKYIELDTTLSIPFDTTSISVYTYDNLKRLSQKEERIFDNMGSISELYISTYVYNAADTLPNRVFKKDVATNKIDTTYLLYSNNGLVIKDSTIKGNSSPGPGGVKTLVTNITVLNDSLRNSTRYYNSSGILFSSDSTSRRFIKSGNTVTREFFYSRVYLPDYIQLDFNFDNKVNPLYRVTIPYPYYWVNDGEFRSQKYNYTGVVFSLGSLIDHFTYTYKYRNDGLPVQAAISNTNANSPTEITKLLYYYTK